MLSPVWLCDIWGEFITSWISFSGTRLLRFSSARINYRLVATEWGAIVRYLEDDASTFLLTLGGGRLYIFFVNVERFTSDDVGSWVRWSGGKTVIEKRNLRARPEGYAFMSNVLLSFGLRRVPSQFGFI